MLTVKKLLVFGIAFFSLTAIADSIISPNDFVFHKSGEANANWKIVNGNTIQATFAPGNPFNASLWFSRIIASPAPQPGQSYRVAVQVRQSGVTDPQARINLDVLGGDANAVFLNTSCFRKTAWAANCADWTTVELKFTLPKAGIDEKWNQAKVFLTSFSALSSNGEFFFKDYVFEVIDSPENASGK